MNERTKGTLSALFWLGESGETLRHIFNVARQTAPAIIFFDQLEAIALVRNQT